VSSAIRVFVNAGVIDLPAGAAVLDAVRSADPTLPDKIASGAAYVTDGRGIEIDPGASLMSGAILRVVVRARSGSTDADA
jgi:hypothetical protein